MPNAATEAISALPLKEMEASLLRSAILEHVSALGLSQPDFREAIDIASFLHRGQTRKQRGSMHLVHYIEHPLRNTLRALRYGVTDRDTLISIVLHDTVEDAPEEFSEVFAGRTGTSEQDAREQAYAFLDQRFGASVAQIVRGLSNPLLPNGLSRAATNKAYIDHVGIAIASPQVFVAKFVDFADNALSLHHSMDRGFVKRQAIKYRPLVALFASRLADADVVELVGPEAVGRMKRQLAGNRLAEFSTADV
jgi:(p)ppGpp synthase/HD superfamily hydrolase